MSSIARRFIRASRVGGEITLGVDGRPREADDPLSGIVGGTPEETQEATSIVEEAQRRAEDLVRQAAREASSIRERAQQSGYDLGYRQGSLEARAQLADALSLAQRVAAEGAAVRGELLRRSEREMVEIVIAGLRSILGEWATHEPALVQQTVRRALERAGSQNVVRVRLHADEAERVVAFMTESTSEPPAFEVFPDGSIGLGGCVIDTTHGRVDARLDAQLDVIAQLLRDSVPLEAFPADERSDDQGATDAA
ncbi:MAG: FliH/SctL family protein [Dehalococcoidia bacterium]